MRRLARMSAVVALAFAAPATALADDTFVDGSTGNDTNTCTSVAEPCKTIAEGIAKAGSDAKINVAEGAYAETLTLDEGKSLVASGAAASTVINPSVGTAVHVPLGSPDETIQGFRLTSTAGSPTVLLEARATVIDNIFNGDLSSYVPQVRVAAGAGTIAHNDFTDPDTDDQQYAVTSASGGSPVIMSNSFSGFTTALSVNAGGPIVKANHIAGTRGPGSGIAAAIDVSDSRPTLIDNLIDSPGTGDPIGVRVSEGGGPATTGLTLRRNTIVGHWAGVYGYSPLDGISLDSDLIYDSPAYGVASGDTGNGGGDVTATNVTIWSDLSSSFSLQDNHLDLDSSIVKGNVSILGSPTCTITRSRGPTTTGTGCQTFQATADPMFVDEAGDNYHLRRRSPMIDKGSKAAPPKGSRDIDGDRRALDGPDGGSCHDKPRRDIGADEYVC